MRNGPALSTRLAALGRFLLAQVVYIFIFAVILASFVARGFFVDPHDALRAVEVMGFRSASVISSQWVWPLLAGCDSEDAMAVNVQAINATGQSVDVLACSGWPFKGWTVRVK